MTTRDRIEESMDRLVTFFGDGATLQVRKRHTLFDNSLGSPVTSLLLDGAVSVGDIAVGLKATTLEGVISDGVQFTIAGNSQVYTVQQSITAAGNALAAVPISPDIAVGAIDGTAVTVTREYKEHTFPCSVTGFKQEDRANTLVEAGDRMVSVSTKGTDVEIEQDDVLLVNGDPIFVKEVMPVSPGATRAGYRIHIGESP